MKAGLALSGGGSLGAYEAGAVRALAELGTNIGAIAGTSIGALNGAVLASSPDLLQGSAKLVELWSSLAEEDILQTNFFGIFTLLASLGLPASDISVLSADLVPSTGIYRSEPIKRLLQRVIQPRNFDSGQPFYIGVAKMRSLSTLKFLATLAGFANTDHPHWFHVQDFPASERIKLIMASASIPFAFAPQQIGANLYQDGGVADWWGETGNTPVHPLKDSGCETIIAILLNRTSLFNRLRYPDTTVIEIRPRKEAYCNPPLKTILSFDKRRILQSIEDGYEDCMHKMRQIRTTLEIQLAQQDAYKDLASSLNELNDSRRKMQAMMEEVKNMEP